MASFVCHLLLACQSETSSRALAAKQDLRCPPPRAQRDPFLLPTNVTLDHVRRCRNPFPLPCQSILTKDDYSMLDNALTHHRAKRLHLAQVNIPPNKHATKNVVLFFSGQYFNSGGESGGLTGQQDSYRFDNSDKGSMPRPLRDDSYAKRLFDLGFFAASDTFVGLVFDARFHYGYTALTKNKIVMGYVKYIESKFANAEFPDTIFLAGHSRGGCLSLRLAQQLTKKYPVTRIIVQAFDPVCADETFFGGHEMGVHRNSRSYNPLREDNDSFVFHSDFWEQYSNRNCLAIHNYLSGAKIRRTANIVHSFGHEEFVSSQNTTNTVQTLSEAPERAWYSQMWSAGDHKGIVDDALVWNHGLAQFEQAMASISCGCERTQASYPIETRSPAP